MVPQVELHHQTAKNGLTAPYICDIVDGRMEAIGLFFMLKNRRRTANQKNYVEVEVVRTKITLACTECKQRNYNMTKDKKTHPDRMETKKYCRFCKRHTLHKEIK